MSNEIVRLSKQLVEAEAAYFDKGFVAVEDSSFGVGDGTSVAPDGKGYSSFVTGRFSRM